MILRILIFTAVIINVSCSTNKVRIVGVAVNAKYSSMIWSRNYKVVFLSDTTLSDYYMNKKIDTFKYPWTLRKRLTAYEK